MIGDLTKTYTVGAAAVNKQSMFDLKVQRKIDIGKFTLTLKNQDLFKDLASLGFTRSESNPRCP